MEEKKIISTLEAPGLTSKRRDGNTTRQVDFAVQMLYKGHPLIILDHCNDGDNNSQNFELLRLIKDRIYDHEGRYPIFDDNKHLILKM